MTYYKYVEPGLDNEPVYHVLSREAILAEYFPWWKAQMEKVHKENLISEENCLEDWIVVHWAWEIKDVTDHSYYNADVGAAISPEEV